MTFSLITVVVICVIYFISTRRKRRYAQVIKIRKNRYAERILGEHFLDLALGRAEEIRCLVYARHYPWTRGYKVWLTWLGEPDTIVSVEVNYWLSPKKRIEIWQWPKRLHFSLERDSFDQATEEFNRRLAGLISI